MDSMTLQLELFEQDVLKGKRTEPDLDSPDTPKPGAFWNGHIWVSDDDLPF